MKKTKNKNKTISTSVVNMKVGGGGDEGVEYISYLLVQCTN